MRLLLPVGVLVGVVAAMGEEIGLSTVVLLGNVEVESVGVLVGTPAGGLGIMLDHTAGVGFDGD